MKNFVLGVIFTVAVFVVGALAYLLLGSPWRCSGDAAGIAIADRGGSRLSQEARTGAGQSVSSFG